MITVTIPLPAHDMRFAKRLAEQSARHFAGQPGHYGNEPSKHFVGHLGEVALARWLEVSGIQHHQRFADPLQYEWCDIETWDPRLTIEVKTWSACHWPTLGRCVAVRQAASVRSKARVLAWLAADVPANVWDAPARPCRVILHGWNEVAEVLRQPVTETGAKRIRNHQMSLDQVRPVETLAALLAGVPA